MIATDTVTAAAYREAFATEQRVSYPIVDAFEATTGYALDRERLEAAALVLACPLKKSAPNWQHGRVLYAAARRYLAGLTGPVTLLDIGSAKGFSALCLLWAMQDAKVSGTVVSVDVIDPQARVPRKTIAEVDGLLTLAETLAPWPEAAEIRFVQSTGIDWLVAHPERIHSAFVDGSHDGETVRQEGRLLMARQETGDLAIFDDVSRPAVSLAVYSLQPAYRFDVFDVTKTRSYAVGVRR